MRAILLAAVFACCIRSPAAATAPAPATIADGITRGTRWMAAFPASELRFDAAVILTGIRRLTDGPELRTAFERARRVADADADHPQRRLWDATAVLPPEQTSRWRVPGRGEPRVATNRVVDEAVHCARNGWRRATLRYLCGPMRDGGGYQSTHALWALVIARDEGCAPASKSARCAATLVRVIAAAPPRARQPTPTRDVAL
jgi:hypothetical protein